MSAPDRGDDPAPSIAIERYRALVEQLRDELGAEFGWQTRVAERLGISQPYPSLIIDGKRKAGIDAIELAIVRLNIDPDFFFDRTLQETPDYTAYLVEPTTPPREPEYWREFLERYEHLDELSSGDLDRIKSFAGREHRVRSWTDWERLAEWLRTSRPSPTFERKRKR
jgi:transcriptional regulator with XRE-family HTH domain